LLENTGKKRVLRGWAGRLLSLIMR
jgi:hypothetical protein